MPAAQRYTDFRFRRVAGKFYADDLDQADAIELACVLQLLPMNLARYAFRWKGVGIREANLIRERVGLLAEPYHRENLTRLTPEIGLALIHALKDGGWKGKGQTLPPVFRMMLLALRERGLNMHEIAAWTGLPYNSVVYGFRQPHRQRLARGALGVVL